MSKKIIKKLKEIINIIEEDEESKVEKRMKSLKGKKIIEVRKINSDTYSIDIGFDYTLTIRDLTIEDI